MAVPEIIEQKIEAGVVVSVTRREIAPITFEEVISHPLEAVIVGIGALALVGSAWLEQRFLEPPTNFHQDNSL